MAIDRAFFTLVFFSRKTPSEIDHRISNSAIHNLSSRRLRYDERKLLGLGINYIPRPPPMATSSILTEFRSFARRLRLRAFFGPNPDPNLALDPSSSPELLPFLGVFPPQFRTSNPFWQPPEPNLPLEAIIQECERILHNQIDCCSFTPRPSLPLRLQKALKDLRNNDSIIIKPADKNLGTVILDVDWYRREGHRQLSDPAVYEPVSEVPWRFIWSKLNFLIDKFPFLKPVKKFLLKFPTAKTSACAFYLLPKLHKPVLVGRPICSYTGYMLEPVSKFLHCLLLPILLEQKNHLPDSVTLLRDLQELKLPHDCFLFTFDVESLYPSIPISAGLLALRSMVTDFIYAHNFDPLLIDLISTLAELVLTHHFLEFDGAFYKQVRGTAMGSNFAVVYACLFLCHLEKQLTLACNTSCLIYFKRYIDDAFGIWSGSEEALQLLFSAYQSFYPEIVITPVVSSSSVQILDICFFKGADFHVTGKLSSKCFQKPLNAYQYIPFSSWHPVHQKKAFIINELKRYLLRESDSAGFLKLRASFYQRLRARGYPKKFLLRCFNQVSSSDRPVLLNRIHSPIRKSKRTPLVFKLDYSPSAKSLNLGGTLNPELSTLR